MVLVTSGRAGIIERMRSLVRALALCALLFAPIEAAPGDGAPRRPAAEPIATVASLAFHSNFWLNLHHVLYADAWDRPPVVTGPARLAGESIHRQWTLDPEEAKAWQAAVDVYAEAYRHRDLLFDRGMTAIKMALGGASDDLASADIPADLRRALEQAAPVYRKHGWAADDLANRAWIARAVKHVGVLAPEVTEKLSRLFRTPWPSTAVRVDAVRVGNRQGAYTSIGPDWIVASTSNPSNQDWAAAEIVFHESSHLLIQPVVGALREAASRAHATPPAVLWHVVLFYVTGEVTRQALASRGIEYVPYLDKTGLFDRAWPSLRRPVESSVPDFIAGRITLDEMATRLVAAIGTPKGAGRIGPRRDRGGATIARCQRNNIADRLLWLTQGQRT